MPESYMVADMTDSLGMHDREFGKFGPFDSLAEAQEFISRHSFPSALRAIPSKECR